MNPPIQRATLKTEHIFADRFKTSNPALYKSINHGRTGQVYISQLLTPGYCKGAQWECSLLKEMHKNPGHTCSWYAKRLKIPRPWIAQRMIKFVDDDMAYMSHQSVDGEENKNKRYWYLVPVEVTEPVAAEGEDAATSLLEDATTPLFEDAATSLLEPELESEVDPQT